MVSTTDFGSVSPGSNPGTSTASQRSKLSYYLFSATSRDAAVFIKKKENKMKKIFYKALKAILRFEHIIYCATDCRVEFFLHRQYYKYAAKTYNTFLQNRIVDN